MKLYMYTYSIANKGYNSELSLTGISRGYPLAAIECRHNDSLKSTQKMV